MFSMKKVCRKISPANKMIILEAQRLLCSKIWFVSRCLTSFWTLANFRIPPSDFRFNFVLHSVFFFRPFWIFMSTNSIKWFGLFIVRYLYNIFISSKYFSNFLESKSHSLFSLHSSYSTYSLLTRKEKKGEVSYLHLTDFRLKWRSGRISGSNFGFAEWRLSIVVRLFIHQLSGKVEYEKKKCL